MAPSLLLLGLLSCASSLPPPRTSFLLNSTDRPLRFFKHPNVTALLLSNDGSTLYVGAQDNLLSLDVNESDVIHLKKKLDWRPSDKELKDCEGKGKSRSVDCPNFVHVLEPMNETHLYTCGSHAYSPQDAFIDTASFSLIRHGSAKGRCPFSPFQRSTALIDGQELFTATTADFKGAQPQISRHFSKDGRPDVSQDSSVRLLEEPTFVSSSLDRSDRKLYFFFSEVGKEFSFIDDLQIPRVAQVCQDDVGGLRILQKKWTSFLKAPLICRPPKELPFNVLQHMFTLQPPEGADSSETLFYGVFTSQWSSVLQSAVCVFRLRDIKAVFTSDYQSFNTQMNKYSVRPGNQLGQCGLEDDSLLAEMKRTFLTRGSVKADGEAPLFVSSGQRYSHVAAMRTQAADGREYTVLFLLTESGFLHRVALIDKAARVVEEIQVFTRPQLVRSVVLSSSKGVLYVGSSEGVAAVPVVRCSVYRTCSQCVLARDPLCGWSRSSRECARPADAPDVIQDLKHGNVGKSCEGQLETSAASVVYVHLNQVVTLQCPKPSNLAALTWTSRRHQHLPETIFIQAADGALVFVASADTFGTYRCEAEEGGYKEVVKGYTVREMAPRSPRNPVLTDNRYDLPNATESYEHLLPPVLSLMPPAGEPEDVNDQFAPKTKSSNQGLGAKVSSEGATRAPEFRKEEEAAKRSYYSALVVVTVLLVVSICLLALAALHAVLHRRKGPITSCQNSPEDGSKTGPSMESVPSLSRPEEKLME